MKKILIILILSLTMCSCGSEKKDDFYHPSEQTIKEVMEQENPVIIDVRTKEEYEELHIVNAINIPYDEIAELINIDKTKTIFVYCKSGSRSKQASETLQKMGYKTYDLGALEKINLPKES